MQLTKIHLVATLVMLYPFALHTAAGSSTSSTVYDFSLLHLPPDIQECLIEGCVPHSWKTLAPADLYQRLQLMFPVATTKLATTSATPVLPHLLLSAVSHDSSSTTSSTSPHSHAATDSLASTYSSTASSSSTATHPASISSSATTESTASTSSNPARNETFKQPVIMAARRYGFLERKYNRDRGFTHDWPQELILQFLASQKFYKGSRDNPKKS